MAGCLAAALLFINLVPCGTLLAREITLRADQQYDFAQYLYQNQQYRRAAEEYQRFAYFFPDDPRKSEAMYLAGDAYFNSREYDTALRIFKSLSQASPLDNVAVKAYFMTSECYLKMGAASQALVQLHNLISLSESQSVRDRALFRMGWIQIEQMDWQAARRTFNRIGPDSGLPVTRLSAALERSDAIPRKNPSLAGTLSILPGAGQVYDGRYQDALAAFLVNVGLIWAAVDAFDQEQYALGGLLSFVGAGFYAGNIYSAVSSAHKYNQRQKENFIDSLKQHLSLSPLGEGGLCLSLNVQF